MHIRLETGAKLRSILFPFSRKRQSRAGLGWCFKDADWKDRCCPSYGQADIPPRVRLLHVEAEDESE